MQKNREELWEEFMLKHCEHFEEDSDHLRLGITSSPEAIFDWFLKLFNHQEPMDQKYVFECKICGKPFDDKDDLYMHVDSIHNAGEQE